MVLYLSFHLTFLFFFVGLKDDCSLGIEILIGML